MKRFSLLLVSALYLVGTGCSTVGSNPANDPARSPAAVVSYDCYPYQAKPKADRALVILYGEEYVQNYPGSPEIMKGLMTIAPTSEVFAEPASNENVNGCPVVLSEPTDYRNEETGYVWTLSHWKSHDYKNNPNLVCTYVNPLANSLQSCRKH